MWVDDLVADVEQEDLPDVAIRCLHEKEPARPSCRRSGHIIARSSQAVNGTATSPVRTTRRPPPGAWPRAQRGAHRAESPPQRYAASTGTIHRSERRPS